MRRPTEGFAVTRRIADKLAITILALTPVSVAAMPLELPPLAQNGSETIEDLGSYELPLSPWQSGKIDSLTAEGRVEQSVWKLPADRTTTLQILSPLRDQLAAQGYDIRFECSDDDCGGFDFRFATRIAPEPEMHVDLGDYRFLSAVKTHGDDQEVVSLVVSKSAQNGYVQVTHVAPVELTGIELTVASNSPDLYQVAPEPDSDFGRTLEKTGFAVLEDLSFATGSAELEKQEFETLDDLASYLKANPERRVALVGHTDAEGSLDGNINLSKRRATSVMETLITQHDVDQAQLKAEGMGYLSPRASNLTDEGRALNRRVEVILTSTQ